ncbi:hypothetical protein [Kineococcus rhizosphaerae]|uniref:Uncharacterized protein n=1 Tax=Kineococcus rhizosphaerae TaxID=559628 RepID=A0A2T0QYM6_9ACTN|nr:hypothetical protein [Kineococcus rhizosphaerae]PRY11471.1 hypothetical protein CLV37_11394 [Kineococcus rhizosphaerae]
MTQRRTPPAVAPTDRPVTWIALAVAFLAISLPSWVQALGGGKTLGYLPAAAFTLAALAFAVQARRCARRRSGR